MVGRLIFSYGRAMADRFTLVFASVVSLTVTCGVIMGATAIWGPDPQTPPIAAMFETLKYGFTVGMLTVFGLLSSRTRWPPTRL
jgi:hypothetical protein